MEYKFTVEVEKKISNAKTDEEKFEIGFIEFSRRIKEKCTTVYIGIAYKALLNLMKDGADWMKNYIFRPTARFLRDRITRNPNVNKECPNLRQLKDRIIISNEVSILPNGVQKFYICRLLGINGNLIYQKIGTTNGDITTRMVDHIRKYWKEGVCKCIVDRVYEVVGMDSRIVESYFRAIYGRRYPEFFKGNDRFTTNVINDYHEADTIFSRFVNNEC